MRRILCLAVIISMMAVTSVPAVEQWREGTGIDSLLSTGAAADIGTNSFEDIVAPLDLLNKNYRNGCVLVKTSSSTLAVLAGEIAISDSALDATRFRTLTTTLAVGWASIDTGAEANSTQYYVYLLADTLDSDAYTATISTSATTPDSKTYYRKIGYFYNDSSGNITSVGNYPDGGVSNRIVVSGTSDITTTSPSYTDMTDMVVYFISSGRMVNMSFVAPFELGSACRYLIDVDGTDKVFGAWNPAGSSGVVGTGALLYSEALTAGAHTIKIQWKVYDGGTATQNGSSEGARVFLVEEN